MAEAGESVALLSLLQGGLSVSLAPGRHGFKAPISSKPL